MFKKNLGMSIAVVAAAAMMLTGCGSKSKETEAPATTAETQAPATEEKATEAKATEAAATEAKATEAAATEAKATEAAATEAKATEAAATEAKETEAPATEAKATEAPATEAKETEAPATEAKETEAAATEAATETEAAELKTAEEAGVADGVYSVEAELEGGTGRAHFEGPLTVVVEDGKAELTFMMSSEHYDYVKVDGVKYERTNTEGNSTFTVPLAGFDGPFAFVGDTTAMSEPHEIDYTVTINSKDLVSAPADAGSVEAATEAEAAAAAAETEEAAEAKETETPATEEATEAKETEAPATEEATEAKETEAAETEMTVTEAQTEALENGTEVETEAELKTAEEAGVEDGVYTVAAELEGGTGRAHFDGDLIVVVEDGKAELTFMMSSEHYDYVKVDGKKYEKTNTEGNSTFTVPLAGFDAPFAFTGDTTAMSKPHEIDYTVTINSKDLVPAPADAGSVETEADTEA